MQLKSVQAHLTNQSHNFK